MSTMLVDAQVSDRLSRQFEAVMRRSNPRDVQLEARRFVSWLCDRLERNNHALMAAPRNLRPDAVFSAGFAARQGQNVLMTCQFLLNDLTARIGREKVSDYLSSTQTRSGRALARRISARPSADVRIASVRFSSGVPGAATRTIAAVDAPFAGTGAVISTFNFRGSYPGALKVGLVVENQGCRSAAFVSAHMKLFARFAEDDAWQPTSGEAFAFIERVAPGEASVIALRGFDCMDLIRGSDRLNRDPLSLRLITRLV